VKDRLRTLVVAGVALLLDRKGHDGRPGQPELPADEPEQIVPAGTPEPRAELAALALLGLGALGAVAFVVVYAVDRIPDQTQFLGLSLGLSLLAIAAALIVVSKRLIVTEEIEESYPVEEHPEEQELVVRTLEESGSRLTRHRLFKLGLAAAGGSLGAALVVPLASLGPVLDDDPLYRTPWRRGVRLVDENGRPFHAADVQQDDFYTAFPQGADPEELGSPIVILRLAARYLDLPRELEHYPAAGVVAYSKICTHAGCAISLYRAPLFQPDEPGPALVCPCHYSTFDPGTGGDVTFGPAGRKLPMLPLSIDAQGLLLAAGTFDEPIGPSWWGVRLRGPET
jgi:ubiquinol-cytochrome c reductase iron-sulfur subunit